MNRSVTIMNRTVHLFLLLLAACFLSGCQTARLGSSFDAGKYSAVYQASLDVLHDRGFKLNRTDFRFGKITTQRQVSPTVFEPWRGQNTSLAMSLSSTVGLLSRVVVVSLPRKNNDLDQNGARPKTGAFSPEKMAAGGKAITYQQYLATHKTSRYKLGVTVNLYRKQYPTRRLIMVSGGNVFDTLDQVPLHMRQRGVKNTYWLKIGQDTKLADQLAQQILQKARHLAQAENSKN